MVFNVCIGKLTLSLSANIIYFALKCCILLQERKFFLHARHSPP